MKLSAAQSGLLFRMSNRPEGQPAGLMYAMHFTGAMLRTVRTLIASGLVEEREIPSELGGTVAVYALTPAGETVAATCRNPNL